MEQLTPEQLKDLAIICQTYYDFLLFRDRENGTRTHEEEKRSSLACKVINSWADSQLAVQINPQYKLVGDCIESDYPRSMWPS